MTPDQPKSSWLSRWWFAPGGPASLLRIALPLMISAGFVSVTLFVDRTMLYWHSESAASAAMGAGAFYWTLTCLPMGMLGYLSTFVSQYRGAEMEHRIRIAYQHAQRIAYCFFPLLLIGFVLAPHIFVWSDHAAGLAEQEGRYLRILLIGGIPFLIYCVQSALLTGQGRTATVLAIDGVATVVNLGLDAILIFGFEPFVPEMGLSGAAIATTTSFWIKVPLARWAILRDSTLTDSYQVGRKHPWEPGIARRLLTYGGPAGLQMVAESACFSVILLQIGKLGEIPMAATTLALGLNVLAFVPLIGLGIGVSVLIGQRVTEGRIDLAQRTVRSALMVTLTYTFLFAALLGFAPSTMISVYSWGTEPERFAQIEPLLIPLLRIIALYCVLDGLQIVFVGVVKGAGDTWFVLLTTIFVSLSATLGGIICQAYYGPTLYLWWYVILVWVSSMGIAFSGRYLSGAWQNKRVIEASTTPLDPAPE